jgi:hypothetical protein
MLAYSYNSKKWVVPRPKNVKTYDETVKFFDSVHKYHGDNLEFLGSLIEVALPKGDDTHDTKEEVPILKFESKNEKEIPKVSNKYPIPEGFKEAHAKYYNRDITMQKFSEMFHVSDTKIREWMKECNLPVRPRGTHRNELDLSVEPPIQKLSKEEFSNTVSVEPPVQVLPVEKPTFKFSLFGYEFSFKAKKKEPPEPINLSDEFPDEVEY